ncbi:FKBP-type peptidyl-prolyl cis-trans isomerase [Acinetobacter rudis]|uniref:Peptidyl-prolyl cis-trans isomerase n=1 Tax=Acinetobacter rudis TaxID=632955 RepID=A0AAW8J8U2_9GAMM|nr:peptidylprolyl isomerase [Acinetobacter rudis]MDQ8935887.1 peptidylprolyl isomerase [Acinetobacter rudis]MDQ8953668.1 peptidylprolyl isomerase [Acinetobacter rudis]MDQ9018150.1 peptidylprolyl isomerase [Acinetobacter rudis]
MTDIVYPNEEIRISNGAQVDLHFSVSIENGVEIDNTRGRENPVSLVIGDGSLLPGFEKALFGLRAGDRRTVSLPPEDAFGPWNPENIQRFDTVKFEQTPVVGHMIEFEDKAKTSLFGVVQSVNDDITEVDFNHPLAGKNITFEVEIFKVTPAGQQGIKLM